MTALGWAAAALVVAFAVVRTLGVERGTPVVQLISYTPYAAVAAVLAGGVLLAAGGPAPGLVCLGGGLWLAALVVPRLVPARRKPPAGGVRLRVMSANVLFQLGDTAALVEQAKVDDIDVLAVQELTHEGLAAMEQAGVEGLFPHRVVHPAPGGKGSGLFSRHPFTATGVRVHQPCRLAQASATVLVPGAGPVLVESAHPCPPAPFKTGGWARDLAAQPPAGGPQRPGDPGDPGDPGAGGGAPGPPRVLLGDFNATLDHAPLRRLLRTGYRDAAAERGRGLLPTWPYRNVTIRVPLPPVTLDHVLADRRITVLDFGTRVTPDSDHRAVVAELALQPSTL